MFWDEANQHVKQRNTVAVCLIEHLVLTEHSSKQYPIFHLHMQLVIQ